MTVSAEHGKEQSELFRQSMMQKKSLTINVELFGRETPVELGFPEVKKMD